MSDLIIRPPRDSEFAAIRALLPEAAADSGRLFWLAFEPGPPPGTLSGLNIVGALAYQDIGDSLSRLRLHVVQNRRRARIGSRMIEFAAGRALQLTRTAIYADADIKNEPAAEPFLRSAGFSIKGTLTAVENEIGPNPDGRRRLDERVAQAEGFPEGSRVVSMEEAPHEQILKMHGDYIAHAPLLAGLVREFHPEQYPDSVALMIGDRVIAFAMVQVQGDVLHIPAWVTAPEYRGKRLGALLFKVIADRMRGRYGPGDIKRVRFEYLDAAVYTRRLVEKYGHTIVRISARFELRIERDE